MEYHGCMYDSTPLQVDHCRSKYMGTQGWHSWGPACAVALYQRLCRAAQLVCVDDVVLLGVSWT